MTKTTKTFLITGATRGLGLATARALSRDPQHRVVLAVRDVEAGRAVARELGQNVEVRALDLSRLEAVQAFAQAWSEPLAGLINNAGLQIVDRLRTTPDGLEETVAVNHLAATALTMGLLPWLSSSRAADGAAGRVLFIGSGTIDPHDAGATRFGFRGARYTTIEALARGDGDNATSEKQRGQDRYATSKMLNTATAAELSRRVSPGVTSFFTLDPGLMAGTGLARTAPPLLRLLWSTVLRWAQPLMPGASTPERSGNAAAWIVAEPGLEEHSGRVWGPDRRVAHVWPGAVEPITTARVLDETLAFLRLPNLQRAAGRAPAQQQQQQQQPAA